MCVCVCVCVSQVEAVGYGRDILPAVRLISVACERSVADTEQCHIIVRYSDKRQATAFHKTEIKH